MRRLLRKARNRLADGIDRLREPGWPRRIAVLVVLVIVLCIPYPLSITGDFEVISLRPLAVRNKIDGMLVEIRVKMGDRVEEGQVVARLLGRELELEREKVKAELAEAQAYYELTQKGFRTEEIQMGRHRVAALRAEIALKQANLARETALFKANDIPQARLDHATSEFVSAKKGLDQATEELKKLTTGFRKEEIAQAAARVEQLQGRIATTQQHLAWIDLVAPIAGEVVTPDHELQQLLGTHLARGTAVMQIISPDDLVARVQIPESEFGDIELGQEVELRSFQYPDVSLEGVVETIEPQVAQTSEFSSSIPVLTKVRDAHWKRLRVHTKGRAKVSLGYSPVGYVLYRRLLRSTFVKLWSWY